MLGLDLGHIVKNRTRCNFVALCLFGSLFSVISETTKKKKYILILFILMMTGKVWKL